jgi:hypothetical protein
LLAFKFGDAGDIAFNAGFAAADLGRQFCVLPKVRLCAFLFEFF